MRFGAGTEELVDLGYDGPDLDIFVELEGRIDASFAGWGVE